MRGAGDYPLWRADAHRRRTYPTISAQHHAISLLSYGIGCGGLGQHHVALSETVLIIPAQGKNITDNLYISEEKSTFASAIKDGSVAQLDRATPF